MTLNDLISELESIKSNDILIKKGLLSFYDYVSINNRPSTLDYYKRALENIFTNIKVKYISEVNEKAINTYIKALKKRNVSNNTINKRLEVLKIFNNYLIRCDYISSSYITKIKKLKSCENETKIIPCDILKSILNFMDHISNSPLNLRNKAIIYLFYETGIRETELINLKLKDFIPNQNMFVLSYTKNHHLRKIFISDNLKCMILEYIKSFGIKKDYLFRTKDNKQITKRAIDNLLQTIKEKLSINISISSAKFRHTLATNLLKSGMSIYDVRKLLDHSSVKITEKYLHINDDELQQTYNFYMNINTI